MSSEEGVPMEVPKEALIVIFSHLTDPKDLAAAMMVCKQWRSNGSVDSLWKKHVAATWQRTGDNPRGTEFGRSVAQLDSQGRYRELFLLRTKIDAQLRMILGGLQGNNPSGIYYRKRLLEMPFPLIHDELELLQSSLECGTLYWAKYAYNLCFPRHITELMEVAIDDPNATLDVALLVARLFDSTFLMQWPDGEDYAYTENNCDFVGAFLDEMAREAKRRMAARGITGGIEALEVVNEVMFRPHPEESRPGDMHHTFPVRPLPLKDGYGYELRGNEEDYYHPLNSLVDFVLMSREGNPISLCILHHALASRVGVRITMLNTPSHVINYYDGDGDDSKRRFIDCYHGGEMFTHERVNTMKCAPQGGWPGALNSPHSLAMSPRDACMRILLNLNILNNFFADTTLESSEQPPSEIKRRLLWAYMSLFCSEDNLVSLHPAIRDTFLDVLDDVNRPFEFCESVEYVLLFKGVMSNADQNGPKGPPEWFQPQVVKPKAKFRVGQVVLYQRSGRTGVGVILDYGSVYEEALRVHTLASMPDPLETIGSRAPGGAKQTLYAIITQVPKFGTIVAYEDALKPIGPLTLNSRNSLAGLQQTAGRFFDRLSDDGTHFIPNAWLKSLFDDTWE